MNKFNLLYKDSSYDVKSLQLLLHRNSFGVVNYSDKKEYTSSVKVASPADSLLLAIIQIYLSDEIIREKIPYQFVIDDKLVKDQLNCFMDEALAVSGMLYIYDYRLYHLSSEYEKRQIIADIRSSFSLEEFGKCTRYTLIGFITDVLSMLSVKDIHLLIWAVDLQHKTLALASFGLIDTGGDKNRLNSIPISKEQPIIDSFEVAGILSYTEHAKILEHSVDPTISTVTLAVAKSDITVSIHRVKSSILRDDVSLLTTIYPDPNSLECINEYTGASRATFKYVADVILEFQQNIDKGNIILTI